MNLAIASSQASSTSLVSSNYKINGVFAPITEAIEAATEVLTPCANKLWRWLRRKGRPQTLIEIDLKDFVTQFHYSVRWAKAAYHELLEAGLWEEEKRWYGGCEYRGRLIEPTRDGRDLSALASPVMQETSKVIQETSKKTGSNGAKPYPLIEKNNNLKQKPTNPPVLRRTKREVDEDGNSLTTIQKFPSPRAEIKYSTSDPTGCLTPLSIEDLDCLDANTAIKDCPPTIAQTLTEEAYVGLGVKITQTIYKLVVNSTVGIVLNAIAAVKERLQSKTAPPVRTKEGLFTAALRGQFTPNRRPNQSLGSPETPKVPEGFNAWYRAAQAARLVSGSTMMDGEMWVYRFSDSVAVRWREMAQQHPELLAEHPAQTMPCQPESSRASGFSEPLDLSDVITQTSVELKRLGWSEHELRTQLQARYGKRSRHELKIAEIQDFSNWVQSQSSRSG